MYYCRDAVQRVTLVRPSETIRGRSTAAIGQIRQRLEAIVSGESPPPEAAIRRYEGGVVERFFLPPTATFFL